MDGSETGMVMEETQTEQKAFILTAEVRELERRLDVVKDGARDTEARLQTHMAECALRDERIAGDLDFIKALLYRVAWGVLGSLIAIVGSMGFYMLKGIIH